MTSNNSSLSEREICSKLITPALQQAGWDLQTQIREERPLTDGRVEVRGFRTRRRKRKRADYVLEMKPNIALAVIEAKSNKYSIGHGMPQALAYSEMMQVPFVFSSNGDGFLFHDKTVTDGPFDLVCHVAFGQPPLTRQERAENVRKRDYFTKYGDEARAVLQALPDKYADEGIDDIESMEVLNVQPLSSFGTPLEIVRLFGSKQDYLRALKDLEAELYSEVG